jgi:hypothetical protein
MKKNLISFSLLIVISIAGYAQKTDAYGGFMDIKGEKTGFFHAEQINDRWSLVTPDGHAFYGIGMAHPVTGFTQSAVHFVFADDQEAWLKGSIQRMRDLGFNCVWSGPYCPERLQSDFVDKALAEKVFREAEIPYVFPLPLVKHFVELNPGEERPDVFSKEYVQFVNEMAAEFVPELKDNPWVMGYYFGFGSFDREEDWIDETINRKDSPGRERLMGILEVNYQGDISTLNRGYGTKFNSFKELKKSGSLLFPKWVKQVKLGRIPMPETPGAKEIFRDGEDLLGEIIEQVYRLGYEAVRKYDQNHMVYGSYVKEATLTTEMWQRVDPYIDVIAPQHVSKAFPIEPIVELLGKPALISDQPYGNVYSPTLLMTKAAHGPVPGHTDRLVLLDILADRISKAPEYIGVEFCGVLFDQSHPNKAYELGQPGYFTIEGEAKQPLSKTVTKINRRILENVQAAPDVESAQALDHKYHETLVRLQQVMSDRKALLSKYPALEYAEQ